MDITLSENGVCGVKIEGELNIYNALEIKGGLIGALEAASSVEIDVSGVSEMDSSGLQILLLAKKEADKAGKKVSLTGVSPSVQNIIGLFSLDGILGGQNTLRRE